MFGATVVITICGDPVTGVWCHRCALPSAIAQVLVVGCQLQLIQQCLDCGARRPVR